MSGDVASEPSVDNARRFSVHQIEDSHLVASGHPTDPFASVNPFLARIHCSLIHSVDGRRAYASLVVQFAVIRTQGIASCQADLASVDEAFGLNAHGVAFEHDCP